MSILAEGGDVEQVSPAFRAAVRLASLNLVNRWTSNSLVAD